MTGMSGNSVQMLKRNATQSLRSVRRDDAEQVVQMPQPLRHLRFCKYPPATQSAQAVNFRQTVGRDKFRAEMKGRTRRTLEERFEIDFINEHTRTNATRDLAQLLESFVIRQHTRRVV